MRRYGRSFPERAILLDSPGFAGQMEAGYGRALAALDPGIDPEEKGVNIAGLNPLDPFNPGQSPGGRETPLPCGYTASGTENPPGSPRPDQPLRALDSISQPRSAIGDRGSCRGPPRPRCRRENLLPAQEIAFQGPTSARSSQRFPGQRKGSSGRPISISKRFDPPRAAVFGGFAYATFAADTLKRYLDADIVLVGSRNGTGPSPHQVREMVQIGEISGFLTDEKPDLVIGSSFERSAWPDAAFVGLTPPLRGRVLLRSRCLAGIEGTLSFMEESLNACMDRKKKMQG